MGWIGRFLGYERYFKERFEEMLEVIREGFAKQDVRITALENRKPVIRQEIIQKVSLSQEEFNGMLKESLESSDVLIEVIKKEVVKGTGEAQKDVSKEVSRQLSKPRQTEDRQTQTEDRQIRQKSPISVLTQTEMNIINILYKNDSGFSYSEMAGELGKSESNIRDKVNSIRKKTGFIVEKPTPGKRKCFALSKSIKREISVP